jgi:hypothetical protein
MNATAQAEPLLSEAEADYIQRGVTIFIATRDRAMRPVAYLASGCRVAPDRREVSLFVNSRQAQRFLEPMQESRVIAANFSQPSSHRSIQLKGVDARMQAVQPGDLEQIAAFRESYVAELALLKYSEAFSRTFLPAPDDSLVAVVFTPSLAYDQTPGQHAGKPLK